MIVIVVSAAAVAADCNAIVILLSQLLPLLLWPATAVAVDVVALLSPGPLCRHR